MEKRNKIASEEAEKRLKIASEEAEKRLKAALTAKREPSNSTSRVASPLLGENTTPVEGSIDVKSEAPASTEDSPMEGVEANGILSQTEVCIPFLFDYTLSDILSECLVTRALRPV